MPSSEQVVHKYDVHAVELEVLAGNEEAVSWDDLSKYLGDPEASSHALTRLARRNRWRMLEPVLKEQKVMSKAQILDMIEVCLKDTEVLHLDNDVVEAILAQPIPVPVKVRAISRCPSAIKSEACGPDLALAAFQAAKDVEYERQLANYLIDGTRYDWTAALFQAVFASTHFRRKRNDDSLVRVLESFLQCKTPPACAAEYAYDAVFLVHRLNTDGARWVRNAKTWAIDAIIEAATARQYVGRASGVLLAKAVNGSQRVLQLDDIHCMMKLAQNKESGPAILEHVINVYAKGLRKKSVSKYDTAIVAQNLLRHPGTPERFASLVDHNAFSVPEPKELAVKWSQEAWVLLWNRLATKGVYGRQKNLEHVLERILQGKRTPELILN